MRNRITVNYKKDWNGDGTCFTQTVNIPVSKTELDEMNKKIRSIISKIERKKTITTDELTKYAYLKECNEGKNYTTFTTFRFIYDHFKLSTYPRIHTDRNTIVNFKYIKETKITQEDKELMLKDICARLPYVVK